MKRTPKQIIEACKSSQSMMQAARKLEIKYDTLRKYAIQLGVWNPNQSGKGISKAIYTLEQIFSNEIYIKSGALKYRLFKENVKQEICERCSIIDWLGQKIAFELHHKDGDKYNNNINNLEVLCPNCHSQTDNFRGRKKRV